MHQHILERTAQLLPQITGGAVLVRETDGHYRCSAAQGELSRRSGQRLGPEEALGGAGQRCAAYLRHPGAAGAGAALEGPLREADADPGRSLMILPITAPGAPSAATVLHLYSAASPLVLADAIPLAELIGAQLALATQRAELEDAANRAERELALLNKIRNVLGATENLKALFSGLVGTLQEEMGYEYVHIGLLSGDALVNQVGEQLGPQYRFPVSRGIVGQVARTGQAQLVQNVREDPTYVAVFPDVVSELCVPLWDGERRVGVLDIETVARPLTGDDLQLMVTLGEWIGWAIERERLYQATHRQRRELDLLHQVRTALGREQDARGVIRAVNEALVQFLGYTHVSVYLRRAEELELQHQIGYPQVIERMPLSRGVMGRVARTGQAAWLEDIFSDPDGLKAFGDIASEVCVPLREGGEVVGVLNVETVGAARLSRDDLGLIETVGGFVNYALERTALYTRLCEREKLYRLLAEHTSDLVCLHHPDGTFAYVSPSVRALLGYDPAQLIGTHPRELLHPREQHLLSWQGLTERLPAPLRVRLYRAGGGPPRGSLGAPSPSCASAPGGELPDEEALDFVWFETSVSAVPDTEGVGYFVTTSRDVTQRRAIERQLAQAASSDPLTGLPNRRSLLSALERAVRGVQGAGREGAGRADYTVLYLDMDRFKVINDSLGHSVGDELLRAFAARLRDVAPPGSVSARLGGDEFAVLLTGPASFEVAQDTATRLRETMSEPFVVSGHRLQVAVSVGIAPGHPRYSSAAEVLRDADLSMYRAKRTRHAPYMVFDPAMYAGALRQLQLEADLPAALAAGELHLAYQPVVRLASGDWQGFEALVRWSHPTLGDVPPLEFVSLAEEVGLIVELGRWVLRGACAWRAALPGPPCNIHLNVSPRQFLLDSFTADVEAVLSETATPPQALHLEVTESTFMENREQAAQILGRLRSLGVRVHIDDFGTGHSNLGFLHQFPVDALKVDRSFVSRLGEDQVSAGVVQAVLALARTLGVETVGEGIETEAQRQHLLRLGVGLGQGYLFSRPLSAEAARRAWLERAPLPHTAGERGARLTP